MLISDKEDFRAKKNTSDRDIMIKRSIHQEDIIILNMYTPNNSNIWEAKSDRIEWREKSTTAVGDLIPF